MTQASRRVLPNDPSTSWFAAMALDPIKSAALQHRIMHSLRNVGPSTYDELLSLLDVPGHPVSASGLRTRTKELRDLGWVTPLLDDGGQVVKRRADGGQPSIVWRACRDGEVTGVDVSRETSAPSDPALDRIDLALLRAAVTDALRLHANAMLAAADRPTVAADAILANNARAMADRLRQLQRHVLVPPLPDQVTAELAFASNDRDDRLF